MNRKQPNPSELAGQGLAEVVDTLARAARQRRLTRFGRGIPRQHAGKPASSTPPPKAARTPPKPPDSGTSLPGGFPGMPGTPH